MIILVGCGMGGESGDSDRTTERVDYIQYSGQYTISADKWYLINATPPFGPRDHAALMLKDNRIHLRGGFYRGISFYQDYWISDDFGYNWQYMHGSIMPVLNDLVSPILYKDENLPGPFSKFSYFDSRYWLIDDQVWSSFNSINWIKSPTITNDGDPANLISITLSENILYVNPSEATVWSLKGPDAMLNKNIINNKEFEPVFGAAVYTNNGYLYISGGYRKISTHNINDDLVEPYEVPSEISWRTSDGKNWYRLIDSFGNNLKLPWVKWKWPCLINDDRGRTWLIGGWDKNTNTNSNEVWYTNDGLSWNRYIELIHNQEKSELLPRHATACAFDKLNRRIISIGGKGGSDPDNDKAFVTKEIIAIPVP